MAVILLKLVQGNLELNPTIRTATEWLTFFLLLLVVVEVWSYIKFQTLGDFVYSHIPHMEAPLVLYDDDDAEFSNYRPVYRDEPLYYVNRKKDSYSETTDDVSNDERADESEYYEISDDGSDDERADESSYYEISDDERADESEYCETSDVVLGDVRPEESDEDVKIINENYFEYLSNVSSTTQTSSGTDGPWHRKKNRRI